MRLRSLLSLAALLPFTASAQDGSGGFGADGVFDPDAEADTTVVVEHATEPDAGVEVEADEATELDEAVEFDEPADDSRFRLGGYVGAEARFFFEDPGLTHQLDHFQPSLLFQPELFFETADRRNQFRLTPFLRYDTEDSQRTHFDLREANWRHIGDGWDLLAGVGKVYWGVTESRHLVDIINQVDGVEDIDEEDRLGQPMLNLNLVRDWGTLSLFAMSGFRERSFPGTAGRLRPALPVREDDPIFESDLEQWYPEFALRYQHSLGSFDIGAHYFHGTGREPSFVPSADGSFLRPRYEIINQVGLDLQYTNDAWLWKLEAIGRSGHGSPFVAAVGGFEYTYFQAFGSKADLGFLLEYLYDGRDAEAPPTTLENDIFAGTRLALNDTQDTSVLAGAIYDPSDETASILVEAERRIGDHWKVELEARLFAGSTEDSEILRDIGEDGFVALRFTRHF